jgi:hypothetical protein
MECYVSWTYIYLHHKNDIPACNIFHSGWTLFGLQDRLEDRGFQAKILCEGVMIWHKRTAQ